MAAKALGLTAIALTDRNTLAGVVRAHVAAKDKAMRMRFIVGARLDFLDAASMLVYPTDRAAYGRLARLLTDGKRRAKKGECHLSLAELFAYGEGQRLIAVPPDEPDAAFAAQLQEMQRRFPGAVTLAASHLYRGDDRKRIARLGALADASATPLIATNDVLYHAPERRALQDVLTCIREGCTIAEAGFRLEANAERHLKPPEEMGRLFRDRPDAVARTLELVRDCRFSLDELKYEYPAEPVPESRTPQQQLARLIDRAFAEALPGGRIAEAARADRQGDGAHRETRLRALFPHGVRHREIRQRERDSLPGPRLGGEFRRLLHPRHHRCRARNKVNLLFERFVSAERNEPPDIDVDFEHERREEVMQHIFDKYGRDRAGIVATVITYRPRSAIRDVGKAMGLSADSDRTAVDDTVGLGTRRHPRRLYPRGRYSTPTIRIYGARSCSPAISSAFLAICRSTPAASSSPAASSRRSCRSRMQRWTNRTVIEWDKDDLDMLGMLKIDVLALGMLTCIRKALDLLKAHYGIERSSIRSHAKSISKRTSQSTTCCARPIPSACSRSRAARR